MRLVVGAGERRVDGWSHHDVKAYEGIDIVCDIWELPEHVSELEGLQATHVIEHFPTAEVSKLLEMLKSLMKDGAELYLEVPNFAWHAELVMQGKAEDAVYYAFGGQLDEWDFHKTGFTPTILEKRLTEAGFVDIDINGWTTLSVSCRKSQ